LEEIHAVAMAVEARRLGVDRHERFPGETLDQGGKLDRILDEARRVRAHSRVAFRMESVIANIGALRSALREE
jgi:hypothetical protein